MSNLTAYIRDCWEAARQARLSVTEQMQRSLDQRDGRYTADKLQSIRKMKGSDLYMLVTKSKCRDAEAWLKDILIQPGLRPWDLTPCNSGRDEQDQERPGVPKNQDAIFEAVDGMRDCINDQFIEGGWYRAFEELLYDMVTFKAGFIKGPILRKERT
ncbi:hemophilus-specific protein, partial [Candidatus Magnetobacterium bavaricum]